MEKCHLKQLVYLREVAGVKSNAELYIARLLHVLAHISVYLRVLEHQGDSKEDFLAVRGDASVEIHQMIFALFVLTWFLEALSVFTDEGPSLKRLPQANALLIRICTIEERIHVAIFYCLLETLFCGAFVG